MSRNIKKNDKKKAELSVIHEDLPVSNVSNVDNTEEKKESVQELLSRLEEDFTSKLNILNELREEHNKIRDKIVLAHDNMFQSYQKLMVTKENLLVNTVTTQQRELAKKNGRDDNLDD